MERKDKNMLHNEMSAFRKLFGENTSRSTDPQYYKWKIYDNPVAEGFIHLEKMDNIAVGSVAVVPKLILVGNNELSAAEIGDTFTHVDYRRRGVAARCIRPCIDYCTQSGIDLIYGTPNELSTPLYMKKADFTSCPNSNVALLVKYASNYHIEKKVAERLKIKWKPLSRVLATFYRTAVYSRSSRKTETPKEFDIMPVKRFPSGLDGRWGDGREDYVFFILRDEKYLNWRFFENPDEYTVFAAIKDTEHLGYAAVKLTESDGETTCAICDFATLNENTTVFEHLIIHIEKHFKEWNVGRARLYCAESSPYYGKLLELGYRKKAGVPVIIFSGSDIGKKILNEKGNWHFTMADSDNI
ncbi:MAG: GNAT family N-acetyltransferase [bacterium]